MHLFSLSINAGHIVDVYGIGPEKSNELIKIYGAQVGNLSEQFLNGAKNLKTAKDQALLNAIMQKKMSLIDKIKQHYGFSFVDFDTIFYPNDENAYTTIEVISKMDKNRLRFVTKLIKPTRPKNKPDFIEKMVKFQQVMGELMFSGQIDPKENQCPVYHCLPGFTHPRQKGDFALFNASAVKEKSLILKTIKNDPNPERRKAAIFLMGHFNDPREIISVLTDYIMDTNDDVRNAAMRVINETMHKAHIHQINVEPFLSLLDSPYDTDRNKALLILHNAADSKAVKQLIIRDGKARLIALLHLKQPNNHDAAYTILKQISGKDFGERNYNAWEQWFVKMNNNKH